MKITTIGIDLAKSVFQVHGVDDHGKRCCEKSWIDPGCLNFLSSCSRV
jgi:transposase